MRRRRLLAILVGGALFLALAGPASATEPERHEIVGPGTLGASVLIEWAGVSPAGAKLTGECPQDATTDIHTIELTVPDGAYDRVDVAAQFTIDWQDDVADIGLPPLQDLIVTIWHDDQVIFYRDVMETWREADSRVAVTVANPPAGTYLVGVCAGESHVDTPFGGALVMAAGTKADSEGDSEDDVEGDVEDDPPTEGSPAAPSDPTAAVDDLPVTGGGTPAGAAAVALAAIASRRRRPGLRS
ncbi:MAG TPA: hypothetical protein VGA36_08575 [Nitriliruptorales bacterium]